MTNKKQYAILLKKGTILRFLGELIMDGNKFVQYLTGISVRKHEFVKRHINICNYGMEKTAIGFLLKGSGEFTARDRKILLNEKEVIYIPKGQVYTSVWSGDPKVSF